MHGVQAQVAGVQVAGKGRHGTMHVCKPVPTQIPTLGKRWVVGRKREREEGGEREEGREEKERGSKEERGEREMFHEECPVPCPPLAGEESPHCLHNAKGMVTTASLPKIPRPVTQGTLQPHGSDGMQCAGRRHDRTMSTPPPPPTSLPTSPSQPPCKAWSPTLPKGQRGREWGME